MKEINGITLIALVVTIIILIILSTISANVILKNGGLINRTQKSELIASESAAREKLTMKLNEYFIDVHFKGMKDAKTRDEYLLVKLKELDQNAKEAEDSRYYEVQVDGWIFWVDRENYEIKTIGRTDEMQIQIKDVKLTTDQKSIKVDVETINGEKANYKYYYKKQDSTEDYKLAKETKDASYTIEGLEQDVTYKIKVEATNKNGTASKEAVGRTGNIPNAVGAIEFGNLVWNSGKAEVTITKTVSDNLQIQYRIDTGDYQIIESGEKVTNLELDSIVTARLWDGTKGGNTASLNVKDLTQPVNALITFDSEETTVGNAIKATVIQIDNESGIDISKCKWVYNTTNTEIGTDDISAYDGGIFQSDNQEIMLTSNSAGTYYLHILTVDRAENKTGTISKGIMIKNSLSGTPETITGEELKGVFVKYDVEYTDTVKNSSTYYEYSSINGWRLMDYYLEEDGKTLNNVKLISTGIPAGMHYYYSNTDNNNSKWINEQTVLDNFKSNILGSGYATYTGTNNTYYALQAAAGLYYNFEKMTFDQGTSNTGYNQGFYAKIKNRDTIYTSGQKTGRELFIARDDAEARLLTLTELNKALGRDDVDNINRFTDTTGLYQLEKIPTYTALTDNKYYSGYYWLASPYPGTSIYDDLTFATYQGGISSDHGGINEGIRPVISIKSSIQLVKKTDSTGFVYYEIMNNTDSNLSPEALITMNKTETLTIDNVEARVQQIKGSSDIDISKCKWVYNTDDTKIGTDESKYTGGTFTSTDQSLLLSATTDGIYYLHVLTVDKAGNKVEKISKSVKVKRPIGTFVKYDVEYTDTYYNNYEYSNINGWRLISYEQESDGKTLKNVKLISTGIPARMYYQSGDTSNNYSKWILDTTKIMTFKSNVLTSNYITYTGNEEYKGMQSAAGFYYNLGQMTFEQGTSYSKKNQGYYTKIKNGSTTYTTGETTGSNLFKARNDASIRMLTLPELNKALGRDDIDSTTTIADSTGLYELRRLAGATPLTNYKYDSSYYFLASPYPSTYDYYGICYVGCNGYINSSSSDYGMRPVITIKSKIQLIEKKDSTGFVYYEIKDIESGDTQDEIPDAIGAIEFRDLKWDNGKAEVTVVKTTNDNNEIQYKIDTGEYKTIANGGKINNLELNSIVTARLWDGTKGGSTIVLNVQDLVLPQAEITLASTEVAINETLSATVIQTDNESGIDISKCKWVCNNKKVKIGTNESSYTGGTFTKENENIQISLSELGTYYLHVLTVDKAGNKSEKLSDAINVILGSSSGTMSNVSEEKLNGIFIKYDVEYTDTYKNYKYTCTNGWRLQSYEVESDGKTLKNVRLISTGIPARMYYYYDDKTNNYSKWITDSTKLENFKSSVLGTDYTTYQGNHTYTALQASAGFYHNLGQMTFEQGTTYNKKNQGYYTKIKNGNVAFTSGETTGNNLFKARNDAEIRMLTLPELNKALGRDDVDSTTAITDATGLYRLDKVSVTYYNKVGYYWLSSPFPWNSGSVCFVRL